MNDISALSNWNTSKIKNMSQAFRSCDSLTSLNGWDISSGTSFNRMCLLAKHPTFSRKGSWANYGTFTPKKGLRF